MPAKPAAWFLILDLALNAFVLCPIIIRRALRARAEAGMSAWSGRLGLSVTLAALLATASAGYLLGVAVHNLKSSDREKTAAASSSTRGSHPGSS
jgi:hypothetical protein